MHILSSGSNQWLKNLKFAQMVMQGPLVDKIVNKISEMFQRGAPNEWNNLGFNKIHWQDPILRQVSGIGPGQGAPIGLLNHAVQVLLFYVKQNPDAREIKIEFDTELRKLQNIEVPTSSRIITEENKLRVTVQGQDKYGKHLVYVPESDRRITPNLFNAFGRAKAQELGWQLEQKEDANTGRIFEVYPDLWKNFQRMSKDKRAPRPDTFAVSPLFIPTLIAMLQEYNAKGKPRARQQGMQWQEYDVTELEQLKQTGAAPEPPAERQPNQQQPGQAPPQEQGNPLIVRAKLMSRSPQGLHLFVNWTMPRNINWRQFTDGIKQSILSLGTSSLQAQYNKDRQFEGWNIIGLPQNKLPDLISLFRNLRYDVTELEAIEQPTEDQPIAPEERFILPLKFVDISEISPYQVAIPFNNDNFQNRRDLMDEFKKIVKFIFPVDKSVAADGIGDRAYDLEGRYGPKHTWCLKGSFNDFSELKQILITKDFGVESLREVIRQFVITKKMKVERLDNVADGYEKRDANGRLIMGKDGLPETDDDKFYADANKYKLKKDGEVSDLMPKQLEGIKWLYSRSSALLGDNTGVGKTIQMVVAADMRTKKSGGRVLIFTVLKVKKQYMQEIYNITGSKDISDDPTAGAKWTVMHYNQISTSIDPVNPQEAAEYARTLEMLKRKYPKLNDLMVQRGNMPFDQFFEYVRTSLPEANQDPIFVQYIRDMKRIQKKKVKSDQMRDFIQTIIDQNFEAIILDECHLVKNDSNTSNNMMIIGEKIPFRWGGSATISANKPIDIHRQLRSVGHRLGRISVGRFQHEFTGMQRRQIVTKGGIVRDVAVDPSNVNDFFKRLSQDIQRGGYPGVRRFSDLTEQQILDIAKDEIKPLVYEQMKSIMQLTNWLVLTNVYKARSKKEVNANLPEHVISDSMIDPTPDQTVALDEEVQQQMAKYRDPDLAVTEMLTYRMKMAMMKTPETVRRAAEIISRGKKVLIFTCFRESAEKLRTDLQAIFANSGIKVVQLMGQDDDEIELGNENDPDTPKKMNVVDAFKDPNSPVKGLVLGILSGGTGIDLPNVVQDVIMNDFDWTPKSAEQAEGRAFRISSKSDVNTQYIIMNNTPDAIYYRTVQKKRDVAERIQKIDQEFIRRIKANQPVNDILAGAQEQHWQLVQTQIAEKLNLMKWRERLRLRTAKLTGWLKKASEHYV